MIPDVMRRRMALVMAIAVLHGHDSLVLGAWGCGVFANDPVQVAGWFREQLDGPFRGAFRHVDFAILDSSDERRFIAPFETEFG